MDWQPQMTFSNSIILLNGNCIILIQISPWFVPKSPINYKPALVQIMTCCLRGTKPLSEPKNTLMTPHTSLSWVSYANNTPYITIMSKLCSWHPIPHHHGKAMLMTPIPHHHGKAMLMAPHASQPWASYANNTPSSPSWESYANDTPYLTIMDKLC